MNSKNPPPANVSHAYRKLTYAIILFAVAALLLAFAIASIQLNLALYALIATPFILFIGLAAFKRLKQYGNLKVPLPLANHFEEFSPRLKTEKSVKLTVNFRWPTHADDQHARAAIRAAAEAYLARTFVRLEKAPTYDSLKTNLTKALESEADELQFPVFRVDPTRIEGQKAPEMSVDEDDIVIGIRNPL